jgi:glycosyltransferase involved in cell wall biosynthesis
MAWACEYENESARMNVIIDALIFETQKRGGISRAFSEILPRMCELEASLQIGLLTAGWTKQLLPSHAQLAHHALFPISSLLRPGRLWWRVRPAARAFVMRRYLERAEIKRSAIWHSTYFTRTDGWKGPRAVTVYDMIPERWPRLFSSPAYDHFRQQKRNCVLEADAVICISEATRRDALDFYDTLQPERVQTVPLAHSGIFVPLTAGEIAPLLPTSRRFLLYVGERHHYKNFSGLLEAYAHWPGRRDVSLVVVGRAWTGSEGRALRDLNVADHVQLLTETNDMMLRALYQQALAFVYPSLAEGFGIPLLEAMACGCPVVAARLPSTLEVAGEVPIFFDPERQDSLIAALDAADLEARTSDRVRLGLQQARRYDWNMTARGTLAVYSGLGG